MDYSRLLANWQWMKDWLWFKFAVIVKRLPAFTASRVRSLVRIRLALNDYAEAHGAYPSELEALETQGLLPAGFTSLPHVAYPAAGACPAEPSKWTLLLEDACDAVYLRKEGRITLRSIGRWRLFSNGAPQHETTGRHWAGLAPLHQGDVDKARRLIAAGARVNARDNSGRTALHNAALSASIDRMELLLEHGADINARDSFGKTPLSWPARMINRPCLTCSGDKLCIDYSKVVDFLLARGATVDLFSACALKDHERVAELLEENAGLISAADGSGATPLHIAADHGHKDLAEFLLKSGAKIDAGNRSGNTPMHMTVKYGHKEMAAFLESCGAELDIFAASGLGMHQRVAAMLEADPDTINSTAHHPTPRDDCTPLHWAVHGEHVEAAEVLLAKGADPDAKDHVAMTPLHLAVQSGQNDLTELLIRNGAEIGARDFQGCSPLHFAAHGGDREIVQTLLEAGADIEARDNKGHTPLMWASETRDSKNVIQLMLEHGADMNARSEDGWTALMVAANSWNKEAIDLLRANGAQFT